ncbi:MAG: hypothetical protein BZY79_02760 [SAR202 cluster bacterium Casp-Chloro-G4]|nr:hypothetical protein [Chloroflexota bacterium]MDA1228215.1 hypothetical protein [Chloroflexota bacterium]PKB61617.1 MAG: hypothetical protein BZY79_02760 [SAR202 cluster bacterium Casp-Chloro-G4]
MADEIVTLDPRDSSPAKTEGIAPRSGSLDGKVVGLLSNNKPNSELLLRGVADLLKEKYNVKEVVEANKGSHRIPAPPEMIDDLVARCDAMVVATAE